MQNIALLRRISLPVILTSKLFFVASCTGGMMLTDAADVGIKERRMERGDPPDPRMAIVASVPDESKGGVPRLEQVLYGRLDEFRKSHPQHSFLVPPGKGKIENFEAEMYTDYESTPASSGTVLVETRFEHEMLRVVGKYAATDRDVKPLYSRTASFFGAITGGIVIAFVLYAIGAFLERRASRRAAAPPTEERT